MADLQAHLVRTARRLRPTARQWPLPPAHPGAALRTWLPTATAALTISAAGLGVAVAADLTATPVSRASESIAQPDHPDPLEPYDRTRGAAPPPLSHTPARTKALMLQRRYLLAVQQQTLAETVADAAADRRHRALAAEAKATEQEQIRLFQEEERRRIKALVARQLAEKLRKAEEAAAAEAERLRRTGQEPPAAPPDYPAVSSSPTGVLPVGSGAIGAGFGARGSWASYHTGVDFRAGYGEPVRAAADGVVVLAGSSGTWAGNRVAIVHDGDITTMSSHLSSVTVATGQPVTAGQVIGHVGQTGRAFGPHLHFEVYPSGVAAGDVYHAVDPIPWLNSLGLNTR